MCVPVRKVSCTSPRVEMERPRLPAPLGFSGNPASALSPWQWTGSLLPFIQSGKWPDVSPSFFTAAAGPKSLRASCSHRWRWDFADTVRARDTKGHFPRMPATRYRVSPHRCTARGCLFTSCKQNPGSVRNLCPRSPAATGPPHNPRPSLCLTSQCKWSMWCEASTSCSMEAYSSKWPHAPCWEWLTIRLAAIVFSGTFGGWFELHAGRWMGVHRNLWFK